MDVTMEYLGYFQYNSILILSYFFISFAALILKYLTRGKTNEWFFSCYRSSPLNPFTYVRMVTHVLGHQDFKHFSNNFVFLLIPYFTFLFKFYLFLI